MKETVNKTLTPIILTKFAVKVLSEINQNNFLIPGITQEMEIKKLSIIVNDFFTKDL